MVVRAGGMVEQSGDMGGGGKLICYDRLASSLLVQSANQHPHLIPDAFLLHLASVMHGGGRG